MNEGLGLTWHSGSVLPFASLWHTLQRLMHLNAMRAKELPELLVGSWQAPSVRYADLLFNEIPPGTARQRAGAVHTIQLASAMGEPAHAFEWSHLGRLPGAARCLVTPGFRICPACAAGGYHSALFSLKALDRCPIHRCDLISHCRCGASFEPVLRMVGATHAGQCRCGQTAFFTSVTCRRPTLCADDIRPMRPVAAWLEGICTLARPSTHRKHTQEAHDQAFLSALGAWSAQLGFCAPPFDQVCCAQEGFFTTTISADVLRAPSTSALKVVSIDDSRFTTSSKDSMWLRTEATVAYRAMTRHIRRHLGRRSERFALQFLQHPDPLAMADLMRAQPQAMVAFAELVFCFSMERFAMNRRWPYRQALDATQRVLQDGLEDPWLAGFSGPEQELANSARGWLSRQVAAARVTHAWRRAQACAIDAMRSGLADWRSATQQGNGYPQTSGGLAEEWNWHTAPPPFQVTWAASATRTGLRFACYPATTRIDWSPTSSTKAERRAAWSKAQAHRQSRLEQIATGPTLSWTQRDGWRAIDSTRTEQSAAKLHVLFLPLGERISVWMFRSSVGYTLRVVDAKLEVSAETPRQAFSAMREALSMYQARYGAILPPKPTCKLARGDLSASRRDLVRWYEAHLAQIRYKLGFWRGAESFNQLALGLLQVDRRLPAEERAKVWLEV